MQQAYFYHFQKFQGTAPIVPTRAQLSTNLIESWLLSGVSSFSWAPEKQLGTRNRTGIEKAERIRAWNDPWYPCLVPSPLATEENPQTLSQLPLCQALPGFPLNASTEFSLWVITKNKGTFSSMASPDWFQEWISSDSLIDQNIGA